MNPALLKNKAVAAIAAKLRPAGSEDPAEAQSSPADEALRAAADDLITAVHAKDSDGVVAALRTAFEMLDQDDAEEPEEGEPEESK